MVLVGGGPGPAGGRLRRLRGCRLAFRGAACTGGSGVETVFRLRAASSGASLRL
jgi:hypothetical protein